MAIFSVWEQMTAFDTEWSVIDKNMNDVVVSDCDPFIVARFLLCLVLRRFFIALGGVPTSATFGGTTKYVLMGSTVLLLINISSNTGVSSK